jgi:putative nucleotidyltransferase with HDIG domain
MVGSSGITTHPVGNLDTILTLLETVRPTVAAHSRRVATYAVRLAMQYGLPPALIETIRVGSLLHDVGKILIPSRLLTKPGRLNDREWVQLQDHPALGVELIERLGFDDAVAEIVLYHHERADGLGYPDGLTGDSIRWPVRIVSVMDAFDALTSPRAYRQALSVGGARSLIAREAGSRYCPWVVSGLLSLPARLLQPSRVDLVPPYVPDGCPNRAATWATETWTAVPV